MSEKLTILAPAKINLYLNVLSKRPDGYHDIESVMQTVGIFDRLNVERRDPEGEEKTITVVCDDDELDGENNIVYSAAKSFFEHCGTENFNVYFEISKRIPKMAGLGGGSSDAAAAIIALNELYETGFSIIEMCAIGAKVGSDVPFLIKKGTCLITGVGDVIESCTPMPECIVVIAVPNDARVSTAKAYELVDGVDKTSSTDGIKSALLDCSVKEIGESMFNKFEFILPDDSKILEIKKKFASLGSPAVMMSGSGSAVFALFESVPKAKDAADALSDEAETFVCAPVRRAYGYIEKK